MGPVSMVSDLELGDDLVESSQQIVARDEMRPPASLQLSKEREKDRKR